MEIQRGDSCFGVISATFGRVKVIKIGSRSEKKGGKKSLNCVLVHDLKYDGVSWRNGCCNM